MFKLAILRVLGMAGSLTVLMGSSMLAGGLAADASPAATSMIHGSEVGPLGIYDGTCSGQGERVPIKEFHTGDGHGYLLRCGVAGNYGYRQINTSTADGYTSLVDQEITNTLQVGERNHTSGNYYQYINSGAVVVVSENKVPDSSGSSPAALVGIKDFYILALSAGS